MPEPNIYIYRYLVHIKERVFPLREPFSEMKMLLKIVCLVACLCLAKITDAAAVKRSDCDSQLPTVDEAAAGILILTDQELQGFPTVKNYSETYCRELPLRTKIFNTFKPCLKPFVRSLYAMVAKSIRKIGKDICGDDAKKAKAHREMECLNPETKPLFTNVTVKILGALHSVSQIDDSNNIIPGLCCVFKTWQEETIEILEPVCEIHGRKSSAKFFVELIRGLFEEATDLLCANYQGPDGCSAPNLMKILNEVYVNNNSTIETLEYKSPVVDLITILERMDEKLNV